MSEAAWVDGLEERAAALLPEPVAEYVAQGAGRGRTTAEAVAAWASLRYRPHVLRDVTAVDTSTTVLGTTVRAPILVAPSTLQLLAHPEGDLAMAAGVHAAGSLLGVSSNTGSAFADIEAAGAPWWLQAYVLADRDATARLVERAVAAGARAIVLTVDTAVVASRRNAGQSVWDLVRDDQLNANLGADAGDHEKARDLSGETVDWLRTSFGLPVVVKGVLRGDDAALAVQAGAAGIIVSNHGGRQLDQAISTVRALPEVAAAVAGRAEVYVDGGLRHGIDVLGAVALGARAVFVGRPALWALTVDGAVGVTRLLGALAEQLEEAMTLSGCGRLAAIGADLVDGGPERRR